MTVKQKIEITLTHTRVHIRRYELCSVVYLLVGCLTGWLAGWLMCVRVHLSI